MSDFDIVFMCFFVPISYAIVYMAGKGDLLFVACKMLQEQLEKYQERTTEEQQKIDGWIPVEEGVPKQIDGEISVEVEVTIQGLERNITGRAFYFYGLGKFYPPSLGAKSLENVIAWKPLPAPYDIRKKEE